MRIELVENYLNSKEFLQKMSLRLETIKRAEEDPIMRQNYLLNRWVVDPVDFINTFGVMTDPRLIKFPVIPLFLFDYQEDIIYRLLDAELNGKDLLIEKVRDMGLSWIVMWYILWRWLFTPSWSALLMSRKLDEVDKASAAKSKKPPTNSLFGKIRFGYRHLPAWLKSPNWRPRFHDTFAKMTHPDIGSVIEGETDNPDAVLGRRYGMVVMDEMFAMTYWEEIWRNMADATRARVGISTTVDSIQAKDFRDFLESRNEVISLNWKQNPFKDEVWYKQELERRANDPLGIQKNMGLSYDIDPRLAYYPEVVKARVLDVDYDPNSDLYVSIDIGARDYTAILWWQFKNPYFFVLEGFQAKNRDLKFYMPFLDRRYPLPGDWKEVYPLESWQSVLNLVRKWKEPKYYFGEIAHFQRTMPTNRSSAMDLYKWSEGRIVLQKNNKGNTHEARKKAVSEILPYTIFNNKSMFAKKCLDALANTKFKKLSEKSTASKEALDKPIHEPRTADFRASFENFAVNAYKIIGKARREAWSYDSLGSLTE